jgi:DNA-binding GntR family transcriptional regulator
VDPAFHVTLERGSRPLHVSIAEELTTAIADGRLVPGTRLPPERQLAEMLGVSRMTVRQALGELEHDGLVRRVVGRSGGTFVREPEDGRARPGAVGLSAGLRRHGGATSVEPISAEIEPAGRRVAAALELVRSGPVVVITRVRLASGKPLAVERSSLPASMFPDIEDMDLGGSLVTLMADGFGIRPVRSVERLELTEARPSDCRALGVRRGAPLLLVERIRYTADGTPVEFARDRFRPDRTRVVLESTEVGE